MTSDAIDWLETSPGIEIRPSVESLPVARYVLSTSIRDGDARLFHQPYQADLAALQLPAAVLPQVDGDGQFVPALAQELAAAEYVETLQLVLPPQQYEELFGPDVERDPEVPALWVQGVSLRQVHNLRKRLDLQPGLFIDVDQSVTILGVDEHPPRFLVALPRVVLSDVHYIADNTEELLSMGSLLEDFVHRLSSPQNAVENVRVATGYLYGPGMPRQS